MMRRYTGSLIATTPDGREGLVVASHYPPKRYAVHQPLHTRSVRKVLTRHRAVLMGADVNQNVDKAADSLGLDAFGTEVVGLFASGATVTGYRTFRHPGSDHPVISATVTLPVKEAPVPIVPTPAKTPKPTDLTTYDGRKVNWLTRQALEKAADILGYDDGKLTLHQGSYNAGKVKASAGTHDGGGVVDLAPYDYARKVKVLRSLGFAAWYRPARPGVWGAHIHAVLIDDPTLSSGAQAQVRAYLAGRNGLADNGPDDGPREHVSARYRWQEPKPPRPVYRRGPNLDAAEANLEKAIEKLNADGKHGRAVLVQVALNALRAVPPLKR